MTSHFKPWQQGRLLITRSTKYLEPKDIIQTEHQERCCIYTDFQASDEGRSRQFIMECNSPKSALLIISLRNNIEGIYENLRPLRIYFKLSKLLEWMRW